MAGSLTTTKLVELLTTPKVESVGTLVLEYVSIIKESSAVLNNAIESDKLLVAGREAARINDAAAIVVELLKE